MKTTQLTIRGLNYHVQEWGNLESPKLFLLHGWMDCGITFKAVAEKLSDAFYVVAPDWRGFGNTEHAQGYWFPDYFADLEKILDHYTPDQAARLVGHSMGGNIALMYAGIRPQRVQAVMSLEALGMAPTQSADAPQKYRQWMQQILSDEASKVYPDVDTFKASIRKGNPSLSEDIVDELVHAWGKPTGDNGAYCLRHDHAHRYANPVRYNFDDVVEVWQQITARVGLVMAEQSVFYSKFKQLGRLDHAIDLLKIAEADYSLIADSGHMLHLEQAEKIADCIRAFFSEYC